MINPERQIERLMARNQALTAQLGEANAKLRAEKAEHRLAQRIIEDLRRNLASPADAAEKLFEGVKV